MAALKVRQKTFEFHDRKSNIIYTLSNHFTLARGTVCIKYISVGDYTCRISQLNR